MLFEPISEQVVLRALRESKHLARERYETYANIAVDYLENRQLEDTRQQLIYRYRNTQTGPYGQMIEPVTIPLTERYIAEAADAYNRPVIRTLTLEDGSETEATKRSTDVMRRHLDLIGYDERLHRAEQYSILLGCSVVWFQVKRGQMRPVVVLPQDIHPIVDPERGMIDPADPDDYLGFVTQIVWTGDDTQAVQKLTYAMVTPGQSIYYSSPNPYELTSEIGRSDGILEWEQPDDSGKLVNAPLQPLTFWHKRMPVGVLIPDVDPDIALANRELNIQWSVLLDTMRVQGWAIPVYKLMDPDKAPAQAKWGSRFPVSIAVGEEFSMQSSPAPYSSLVDILKHFVQTLAIAHRQSPNDFSIQQAATSGFAKVVDSLPKMEARRERLRRLKFTEEQRAWPRVAACLKYLGLFNDADIKLRLRVEFEDIDIPLAPAEEAVQLQAEISNNLTNPVRILAHRMGISEAEAREIWEENREINGQQPAQQQQPPQKQPGGLFAGLIGQRQKIQSQQQ